MAHRKRGLVAGIFMLAIAVTPFAAVAGPLEDGLDAFNGGDYATALRLWQPLAEQGDGLAQAGLDLVYKHFRGPEAVKWYRLAAEQGDRAAQSRLGDIFLQGLGVPQDVDLAVKWYRLAAEQGDTSQLFFVGSYYANDQDYAEAAKWYLLAAEQGDASAPSHLGAMYDGGLGVPQDYAEALKWYLLAAEQGDASAQSNLGVMYEQGRGVPPDLVRAHMWFNLAASRLRPGKYRDKTVLGRDAVAERMTPAQIAEAQKLAGEWGPK